MSLGDVLLVSIIPSALVIGGLLVARCVKKDELFRTWNLALAALHLSLASVVLALTVKHDDDTWAVDVKMAYNKWDVHELGECREDSPCYIYTETDTIGPLESVYVVPMFSFVSGLHHLVAFLFYDWYINIVDGGVNWVRWLDYGISSSLMLMVLELLFLSPPDLRLLVFTVMIQVLVILAGYSSDAAEGTYSKVVFGVATTVYLGFVGLQSYLFSRGMTESGAPSVVYIFVGYIFATFSLFAVVQGLSIWFETEKRVKEVRFAFLSFFSKAPLLVTFYFGLASRSSSSLVTQNDMCAPTTATTKPAIKNESTEEKFQSYIPFVVTSVACLILGMWMIKRVNTKYEPV